MANRYCTNCGHPLVQGDNFCTGCGAAIPHNDGTDAVAPPNVPTQVRAPSNLPVRGRNLLLLIALGAVALLVLGVGTVAALSLLRGEPENQGGSAPPPENRQEDASTGEREATEEAANVSETTESSKESDSKPAKDAETPQSEKASGPAPGYNRVQGPSGGLSVEVPSGWGVETGADSENEAGEGTWSYYAGEYLNSSITTAPSLDTWYTTGSSGAYMVASKVLAQEYTDYELTHSLLHASKEQECTTGPYEDLDRSAYTGKMQAWFDCGADGRTIYTVAAAPEGRECVVLLDAIVVDGAERDAIEHIFDTFEVDCGRVTSKELASSPAPATATASTSPSDEAQMVSCDDFVSYAGNPSHYQAQQFYDYSATPDQQAALDADGDGFACDELESGVDNLDDPSSSQPSTAAPEASGCADPSYKAQNPGECGTTGVNPVSDPDDNYHQGVVVGDDTPDCARPEDVLESGLCAQ